MLGGGGLAQESGWQKRRSNVKKLHHFYHNHNKIPQNPHEYESIGARNASKISSQKQHEITKELFSLHKRAENNNAINIETTRSTRKIHLPA